MLGLVLCGGKSERMGTDKGLMPVHAGTWAQSAVDKIESFRLPVVLSVNPDQYSAYSSFFPLALLIKDNEMLEIGGPLRGLLSVHLEYPTEDLLVLACDLPLMPSSLVQHLLNHYQRDDPFQAYLFTNEGEPEPLCAIYKAKGLSLILGMYNTRALTKSSMKFMIEQLAVLRIPLHDEEKNFFRNFNTHADLGGLQA